MPRKTDIGVVRTIGIDTGKVGFTWSAWMRGAPLLCARKSLGTGLLHDLRTFNGAWSGSKPAWPRATWLGSWLRLVTRSNKSRQLMPSRFDRAIRMTSVMPTRLRRLCNVLRRAVFRSRPDRSAPAAPPGDHIKSLSQQPVPTFRSQPLAKNRSRNGLSTNRANPTTTKFMIAVNTNTRCQPPLADLIRFATGTRNADAPLAV